ncbi:hypothetical protein FNV43_RR19591 [Rhamnella rubrinervis]|uniref:Uncharacterized protein n=1 Tax=Rhamnella rubrinervis TaxID=2594499 RepID=A0A8K0DX37_9ROSA|nr:hypothetical protein FNV43_RR19591 [Rhamnella rubrinervis]
MRLSYSRDISMDYRWVIAHMYMCMEVLQQWVYSSSEVSDAKSRYEPPKRDSKDDSIVLSDPKEVEQEDELKDNKRKWSALFDAMLDEEQQILVWEYMCRFIDALPFEEEEPLLAWFTSEEDYKKE